MTDEHLLRPDHAPTPFTAAQIRAHCRDGHRLTIRTEADGRATLHRNAFRDGDAAGVTIEAGPCDADGTPTGPTTSARVTWAELQAHASFPAGLTVMGEETISGPLGILPCRRYAVQGPDGPSTFWFAVDHPGMPVRYERAGSVVTVLAIEDGSAG